MLQWIQAFLVTIALFFSSVLLGEEKLSFEESLKKYIHLPEEGKPTIGHILIDDRSQGINQSTWIYVSSALNYYKKNKPACIILELNTPGGEVFPAQRISEALKEMDTQYDIPVIAYINNWAISAGAMLAYSSRFIVIAKDASMGAAEPIYISAEGKAEEASEKINSALRTDFANRATFFGRNPFLAEAMVDKDIIIVMRGEKIIKLDSEDQIHKEGKDPDIIISPKGKLLTLDAQKLIEFEVAEALFEPQKRTPLSEEEIAAGIYSLSKTPFVQIPFFKAISQSSIISYQMNWQTKILVFLASPAISSLLVFILMVSLYLEISTPGFGVPGTVALLSAFFLVLSSFALEAIHWLEPLLFFFGLGLVALEVLILPTVGVLLLCGGILMVVGFIGMLVPGISSISFDGTTINAAGEYVLSRLSWIAFAILAGCGSIFFLSRYLAPRLPLFQKIVLADTSSLQKASENPLTILIGKRGIVSAALRPAGKVSVDNEDFDAVSSGTYLKENTHVHVIRIEGSKIIVEELYEGR